YQMLDTWGSDPRLPADKIIPPHLQDVLLSQGLLYACYNDGGSGTGPRGNLVIYPLAKPSRIPDDGFPTLFNPVALAVGGDDMGRPRRRLFVLDQGDTCLARANPGGGSCGDTTGG